MRKTYYVKATVFDMKTEEPEKTHNINFSNQGGRNFLNSLIFSCINTGKGVAIELDRTEPEAVSIR
jgi:hypothetical protein